MRARIFALVILLASGLALASPVASQSGRGAIVEGNLSGVLGAGSLNPLRCDTAACRRITDFLFPTLVGVDPVTGTFVEGGGAGVTLAQSWDVSPDGAVYTFHLRDDLQWSDGAPVTAYDVFYSYLAVASDEIDSPYTAEVNAAIQGVVPLDAHTVAFLLDDVGCSALHKVNFPIIPAHVFEPDFAGTAAAAFTGTGDLSAQFARWQDAQAGRSFASMVGHSFDEHPAVTAGVFRFVASQPTDYIRLVADDGMLGFNYVDVPNGRTQVARFLAGELNVIVNPPYTYWDDIQAADDVRFFEYLGNRWDYIVFNLADPRDPQSAFDEEGNRLKQGRHPIFADLRVRRAVQMAIDVQMLIDVSFQGHGTVMPANQLPTSWAFNPDLAPVPYDPMGASRLLEEAGWKDTNDNGIRECIDCLDAEEGAPLMFELLYVNTEGAYRAVVAGLIQEQLLRVGFNVNLQGVSSEALSVLAREQRYDAILAGRSEGYPVDADQSDLFTSAADVVETGGNTGSYYNERVDALLTEARHLPGCDYAARAELYRQAQAILQEDQPYVWLFAPNHLVAVRGGVTGFAPYPYAPFWNVREWIIVR